MRLKVTLVLVLALGSGLSGAREETAVPVGREPAHHQVLANDRLRIYRVEVAPHAATLLHQHDHDYLWVALGDSSITNAVRGKPEVRVSIPDATARFAPGGFAHVARNEADTPFRNVTIELLRPQVGAQNLCAEFVPNAPLHCPTAGALREAPGGGPVPEFETDQVSVSLIRIEPGSRLALDTPPLSPVLVALDRAEAEAIVEIAVPGGASGKGTRRLSSGDVFETPRGVPVVLRATGPSPARFLRIDFKD